MSQRERATQHELEVLSRFVEDLERRELAKDRLVKLPTKYWVVAPAIAGCAVHPKAKA